MSSNTRNAICDRAWTLFRSLERRMALPMDVLLLALAVLCAPDAKFEAEQGTIHPFYMIKLMPYSPPAKAYLPGPSSSSIFLSIQFRLQQPSFSDIFF